MAQTVEWQTGICDCGRDSGVWCLTCFCPYVVFGEIAEELTESDPARNSQLDTCFIQGLIYGLLCHFSCCLVSVYTYKWRTKLRNKYKLKATPFQSDLLTHCLCHCCALCQERRELKDRQGVATYSDRSTFQNPTAAPNFKSNQMVRWFRNSHKPIGRSVHSKIDQLWGFSSLYIVDLGSEGRLCQFASSKSFHLMPYPQLEVKLWKQSE